MKRPLEKLKEDHVFFTELWKFYKSFAELDNDEPGYWDELVNQACAFIQLNEESEAKKKFILALLDLFEENAMKEKRDASQESEEKTE